MTPLLLLLACGQPGPTAAVVTEPTLTATVAAKQVAEGQPVTLTVDLRQPVDWQVAVQGPAAQGLTVQLDDEQGPTTLSGAVRTTRTYTLTGPAGSYVVQPGAARVTSPAGETSTLTAPPVFVDIGVAGPLAQGLHDYQAPPPPEEPPWALYAAMAGVGLLAVGAAVGVWAWSRRQPVVVAPPPPPHVAARTAWGEVRARAVERGGDLDDHAQAVALSVVLRQYLEAITGWPATRRTGPEILRFIEREAVAGASAKVHAGQILSATDRLKFAREGGGEAFFTQLDDAFDRVIEATRPVHDRGEGAS
ncbi:MAG: DUF4381 family protein [Alphaproteobacteria bacterium]|nr:DUF4381 family protein [Alphaproteobacteria bacterium]